MNRSDGSEVLEQLNVRCDMSVGSGVDEKLVRVVLDRGCSEGRVRDVVFIVGGFNGGICNGLTGGFIVGRLVGLRYQCFLTLYHLFIRKRIGISSFLVFLSKTLRICMFGVLVDITEIIWARSDLAGIRLACFDSIHFFESFFVRSHRCGFESKSSSDLCNRESFDSCE